MKFTYREGSRVAGVSAQVAGEELERIRQDRGAIVAHDVVEAARPDAAPLHPAFEWDDIKAAEAHRQWQARHIIKAVRVVMESSEQGKAAERPYVVHVPSDNGGKGHYQRPEVVAKNIDQWERALSAAISRETAMRSAVLELQKIAEESADADKLAMLAVALKALDTAGTALRGIHH